MDNLEAMFWLATLRQAQKGDETARKHIEEENELRAEMNLPTIQEELKAADRAK